MESTDPTAENGVGQTIDEDRYVRAIREDMSVARHGPGVFDVTHSEECYRVDLERVYCGCADHKYRDAVCKHLIRAAVFATFTRGVHTRFVARVVAAASRFGCAEGYHACDGPVGDTYPCPVCVNGTSTGDWTVWSVLVDGRPAQTVTPDTARPEPVVATDGGRVEVRR